MGKKIVRFLIFFLVLLCLFGNVWASQKTATNIQKTNDALKYSFIKSRAGGGRINVHIIEINPTKYRLKLSLANEKIGKTATMADIVLKNKAIAGVNGTFFTLNYLQLPISHIMIDGRIIYLANLKRTACGITENNELFFDIPDIKGYLTVGNKQIFIWGMNRPRKKNEIIVYTKEYNKKTTATNNYGVEIIVKNNIVVTANKGNNAVPANDDEFIVSLHGRTAKKFGILFVPGEKVFLDFTLKNDWTKAKQIFAGGPRLLKAGKIVVAGAIRKEKFKRYLLARHPRTAIGLTKNKKIILMVVDGRSRQSVGATYYELANLMAKKGCIEAMALDGGNSSVMWYKGRVVNFPSGWRKIANAVITIQPKNNPAILAGFYIDPKD